MFFKQLLKVRNVPDYDVDQPMIDDDPGGGVDKFGRHLKNLQLQEDFLRNVRHVILVSDNDDANAFERVCEQIRVAQYNVPEAPRQWVKTRDKPELAVLLIPAEPPGCLESVCHQAACARWPELAEPLQHYIDASPAGTWAAPKQAKTAIECIMAATCHEMPEVPFHWLWQKEEEYHLPLDDKVFDDLVGFLTGIGL